MPKNVVIIGAGGHAKVIADIILRSGDKLVGFLDDDATKLGTVVYKDYKVIGAVSDCVKYHDAEFIVAIGDNKTRAEIANGLDVKYYTAVHPSAVIADTVKIGVGSVVMAGAAINVDTVIGEHCIINTGVTVDHDCVVDDFAHVSPGAHLAGTVRVGERSWICIGASVINNVNVGSDVVVGAGATVLRDIDEKGVYVGVPARRVKK